MSECLGSHLHRASPNPLTRSGVLKHVVGSLGTSFSKQNSTISETEVRARGREACVWHTWKRKDSVEDQILVAEKKEWKLISLTCYLLLEADFAQHFVDALFDEEGF